MIITPEMTHIGYEVCKDVFAGKLTRQEKKKKISNISGMCIGSAIAYVTVFIAMMEGKKYTRTLNTYSTKYFLENIRSDFGELYYKNAISAVKQHIEYYNSLGHGNLVSIQNVIDEIS